MSAIDPTLIVHIATLANLPMTVVQAAQFAPQLDSVLEYTQQVPQLSTDGIEETCQVTGLENVFRDDVVTTDRMFTQEQELSNAHQTYGGYFLVPAVLEE